MEKSTVNADDDRDDTALPLPTLGWVALSRSRLNRAEAQLVEETTGVRDEIGVLALHTGYANRFFPGTSTQQTRLRYALFVPWQIADLLRQKTSVGHARLALEKREIQLANRLRGNGTGVIGVRNAKLGRPVAIPPSSSYWVALRTWGIVNTMPSGIQPSRNDVFSHWDKWREGQARRTVADDEGRALDMFPRLFTSGLPEPQGALRRSGSLNFELSDEERRFLRARLAETTRWFDGKPSLLAALAIAETVPMERDRMWSPRITCHADTADRKAIARARDAASLSAVARALYAAAVETLQNDDGVPSVTTRHPRPSSSRCEKTWRPSSEPRIGRNRRGRHLPFGAVSAVVCTHAEVDQTRQHRSARVFPVSGADRLGEATKADAVKTSTIENGPRCETRLGRS